MVFFFKSFKVTSGRKSRVSAIFKAVLLIFERLLMRLRCLNILATKEPEPAGRDRGATLAQHPAEVRGSWGGGGDRRGLASVEKSRGDAETEEGRKQRTRGGEKDTVADREMR